MNSSVCTFQNKLKTLDGKKVKINCNTNVKGIVFVFILPDCPFSQFYATSINQVYSNFNKKGYQFYGIVPGNLYSIAEIDSFKNNYEFIPEILIDYQSSLTKQLKVSVVPQAIFTDNVGRVLYTGKIDDQAIAAGQKKYQPTKFYLLDALKSHFSHKTIIVKETKPVGCFIE